MKLIIDIPKYIADMCKECGRVIDADTEKVGKAIKNGTPLPKGHGRLIDADELKTTFQNHHDFFITAYGNFEKFRKLATGDKLRVDEINRAIAEIANASTIIEPESEDKE